MFLKNVQSRAVRVYTRTRPVPAGKGRVGYDLHGYGYGATGMDTSGYLHALLAEISLFLPHVVYMYCNRFIKHTNPRLMSVTDLVYYSNNKRCLCSTWKTEPVKYELSISCRSTSRRREGPGTYFAIPAQHYSPKLVHLAVLWPVSRNSLGREFHSLWPSTENARRPYEFRRYDGTTS